MALKNTNKQYHDLTVFNEPVVLGYISMSPNGAIRQTITKCACPECSRFTEFQQPIVSEMSNRDHSYIEDDYIQQFDKIAPNADIRKAHRDEVCEILAHHIKDTMEQNIEIQEIRCDNCGWSFADQIGLDPAIFQQKNSYYTNITACVCNGKPDDKGNLTYKLPDDYLKMNKAIEITETDENSQIVKISRRVSLSKVIVEDEKLKPITTQIYSQDYDLIEHKLTETLVEKDEITGKSVKLAQKDLSDLFKNHANIFTMGYHHHKNNYAELIQQPAGHNSHNPLFMPSDTLITLTKSKDASTHDQLAYITRWLNRSDYHKVVNAYMKDNLGENLKLVAQQKAAAWGYTDIVVLRDGIGQYVDKNMIGDSSNKDDQGIAEMQLLTQMLVKYPAMYHSILEKTNNQLNEIMIDKVALFKEGKIKAEDIAVNDKDRLLVSTINIKDGLTKLAMMPNSMLLKIRKANNLEECKTILAEDIFTSPDRTALKYGDVNPETLDHIKADFEKDPIATACNMWSIATLTPKDGRTDEVLNKWLDIIEPTKEFNKDRFKLMTAKQDARDVSGDLYRGMYEHSTFPAFSGMLQCPSGQESKLARIYMINHPGMDDPTGVKSFIKNVYRQGYTYKIFQKANKTIERYERLKADCNGDLETVGALMVLQSVGDANRYQPKEKYLERLTAQLQYIPAPKRKQEAERILQKCIDSPFMSEIKNNKDAQMLAKNRDATYDFPSELSGRTDKWVGLIKFKARLRDRLVPNGELFIMNAKFGDRYLHEFMSQHVFDLTKNGYTTTPCIIKGMAAYYKNQNNSSKQQIEQPAAGQTTTEDEKEPG